MNNHHIIFLTLAIAVVLGCQRHEAGPAMKKENDATVAGFAQAIDLKEFIKDTPDELRTICGEPKAVKDDDRNFYVMTYDDFVASFFYFLEEDEILEYIIYVSLV